MRAIPRDTIFALSSGSPPAAIAVVRISGPLADAVLTALTGKVPAPRSATVSKIRDPGTGEVIDNGLVLRFAGPDTATGEDLAELHLHGGRSVVAAALRALEALDGMRPAQPGEFTRRAFENGRIDLAEAEGLADLLEAETEAQRRSALVLAGGALSRQVEAWQARLLAAAAQVEAELDFADEDEVQKSAKIQPREELHTLAQELGQWLSRPGIERLRDGIRIVVAGPPNAGKSSLFNVLVGREAAITSAMAGTTRDLVEAPTAIGGAAFLLIDTAGLRDSEDEIETIGIARAQEALVAADLILWLGEPDRCPDRERSLIVQSKADSEAPRAGVDLRVSAKTGVGIPELIEALTRRAGALLPREGEVSINRRHRGLLAEAAEHIDEARNAEDLLVAAEALRLARMALDRITGRAGVEDMLDSLFGRFCIGK